MEGFFELTIPAVNFARVTVINPEFPSLRARECSACHSDNGGPPTHCAATRRHRHSRLLFYSG